jgi:2-C-methyl-D-erythritol 4-phosphate cytidylyltransferase
MNFEEGLKVLIPAAGRGNRSGMQIPKTLQEVDGLPIIVHILRTVTL